MPRPEKERYGLAVTQDARTRRICEEILAHESLTAITAEDGDAALAAVAGRGAPEIVLTELSLPLLDGFGVLKELRKRFPVGKTKAIVISAFAELRAAASRQRDELGIAWILPGESVELFVRHAVRQTLAGVESTDTERPTATRHQDPGREQRMRAMQLFEDEPTDDILQRIVTDTARLFDVPVALVSLVQRERQWFKAHYGLGGELLATRSTPIESAFCRHVVDSGKTLVVPDATTNPYFRDNPLVRDGVVGSYAGAPLITPDGEVLGTLCIIDGKPLRISMRRVRALEALARRVVGELQTRIDTQSATVPTIAAATAVLENTRAESNKGALMFGTDRCVRYVQDTFGEIVGLPDEDWQTVSREDLIQRVGARTEYPAEFLEKLQDPPEGPFAFRGEFEIAGPGRRTIRWIEEPIRTEEGAVQVCIVEDVTEEQRTPSVDAAPALEPAAERGTIHRSSQVVMDSVIRARRSGHAVSLVLFDVSPDHAGNAESVEVRIRTLTRINEILRTESTEGDVVLRWGAREFLAVLPQRQAAAAASFAERVKDRMLRDGCSLQVLAGVVEMQGEDDLLMAIAEAGTQLRQLKRESANPTPIGAGTAR